jgi:hypothetical protein
VTQGQGLFFAEIGDFFKQKFLSLFRKDIKKIGSHFKGGKFPRWELPTFAKCGGSRGI